MEARLEFEVDNGVDAYAMHLFHAAGDSLVFGDESLTFQQAGYSTPKMVNLGAGHQETGSVKRRTRESRRPGPCNGFSTTVGSITSMTHRPQQG